MRTSDFQYHLPPDRIAQQPASERDESRLLILDRSTRRRHHDEFRHLRQWLQPGDLLVLNDTRVLAARLRGIKSSGGGKVELLLLQENGWNDWWAMIKPGKRLPVGSRVELVNLQGSPAGIVCEVMEKNRQGHGRIQFHSADNIHSLLDSLGEMPLPPYIEPDPDRVPLDRMRYQTVYSKVAGSVAAPTAGLHFTEPLLEELKQYGVETTTLTLHVGAGTFAPVKVENITDHVMHAENYRIDERTVERIHKTRSEGHRIVAVGTTSLRVLEAVARKHKGQLVPESGHTDIFIYPPATFQMVDALITNFHLPGSTLLMLVSAFASPGSQQGIELIKETYREAIDMKYRFFSYGDAMLIQ